MKEISPRDLLKVLLLDKYEDVQGDEQKRWRSFFNCHHFEASFSEKEILITAEKYGCCSSWPVYLMRIWKEKKEIKISIIPVE